MGVSESMLRELGILKQPAKQLAKQEGDTVLRTYDSPATRVRDALLQRLSGLEVLLSRFVDRPMVVEGRTLLLPQHSAEAEAAMSAELVACTLSGRHRPELVPAPPFA